jgi:hypothetical protein
VDGAHASPDVEQDGALNSLFPDDVDQLLRRAMQAPAAPSRKVLLCIAAVVPRSARSSSQQNREGQLDRMGRWCTSRQAEIPPFLPAGSAWLPENRAREVGRAPGTCKSETSSSRRNSWASLPGLPGSKGNVLIDSYARFGGRLPLRMTLDKLECSGGVAQW